jgi:hypothetical protein
VILTPYIPEDPLCNVGEVDQGLLVAPRSQKPNIVECDNMRFGLAGVGYVGTRVILGTRVSVWC